MVVSPGTDVAFCYCLIETSQRTKQTDTNNTKKTAEKWNQSTNLKSMPEVDRPLNSVVREPEMRYSLCLLSYFKLNFLLFVTQSIRADSAEHNLGSIKTGQHQEVRLSDKWVCYLLVVERGHRWNLEELREVKNSGIRAQSAYSTARQKLKTGWPGSVKRSALVSHPPISSFPPPYRILLVFTGLVVLFPAQLTLQDFKH